MTNDRAAIFCALVEERAARVIKQFHRSSLGDEALRLIVQSEMALLGQQFLKVLSAETERVILAMMAEHHLDGDAEPRGKREAGGGARRRRVAHAPRSE